MSAGAPIVVVGGGLAAGTFVTELRERGDDRPVVLLTDEPHAPYERPPLSKDILLDKAGPEKAAVHDDEGWYAEHDVDLRTGTSVTALDLTGRRVQAGGEWLDYETLVLATGARPRPLPMADASGVPVVYLRSLDDSLRLHDLLTEGSRVAIIGGGWIGLEVASAARSHGAEVTVLEALELPLLRVLGKDVAQIFADLHREHGVDLRTGVQVTAISPRGEGATLALDDGTGLDADVLVVGVGVQPNVELAEAAGLAVDNGIRVDAHLRTADPHVYAIGDVANADHPVLGHPLRVEHWDNAIKQGRIAAANVAGGSEVHDTLPYFFTDQYDLGMEYVGHPGPEGYDRVVVQGDVPARVFTAWWLRGDLVVAGMHANDWDAIDRVRATVGSRVDPETMFPRS